jgi:hypothetical protein
MLGFSSEKRSSCSDGGEPIQGWVPVDATKEEIKMLEEAEKYFEEKLNEVRRRLEELRKQE